MKTNTDPLVLTADEFEEYIGTLGYSEITTFPLPTLQPGDIFNDSVFIVGEVLDCERDDVNQWYKIEYTTFFRIEHDGTYEFIKDEMLYVENLYISFDDSNTLFLEPPTADTYNEEEGYFDVPSNCEIRLFRRA